MQDLKRVPGRKTDVKDSEWLAQLLECGLLKASFVPPPPIRELRDLTRYRVQQVRDRAQEINRLCKVLEDAGRETDDGGQRRHGRQRARDAGGVGRGDHGPAVLADLARGGCGRNCPRCGARCRGRFRPHHAFLLEQIFAKIDFLEETIAQLTAEIDGALRPFAPMLAALDTIPGVDRIARDLHRG